MLERMVEIFSNADARQQKLVFRALAISQYLCLKVHAPAGAPPMVILPGFGNMTGDYTEPFGDRDASICAALQLRDFQVSVVEVWPSFRAMGRPHMRVATVGMAHMWLASHSDHVHQAALALSKHTGTSENCLLCTSCQRCTPRR
jgi:hypothetical protein